MKSPAVFRRAALALGIVSFQIALAATPVVEAVSPATALERLQAGNERFATQRKSSRKPTMQRRKETAEHQHPFAVVVECADSRVGPETIFDQTIGDLFVVRTAGNLVDTYALGSIEYAVGNLGARLIVVVGHQRCGAVAAAVASDHAPGHIDAIVRDIQPAVREARKLPGEVVKNAIGINAELVAAKIRDEAEFGAHPPEVQIVTGYYELDTGRVIWTKK